MADWQRIETGSLAWLHTIQFVDAGSGWAGGSNGTLLRSTDAGSTWKIVRVPATDAIRDIYFRDPSTGWLLLDRDRFQDGNANRSYLLRTADAGRTWSTVEFTDAPDRFARMIFTDNGAGFVVGEGGFMTAIPGTAKPELRFTLPEKYLMLSGKFFGPEKLLLVGGGGSIVWTDDGGRNWNAARFVESTPTAKFYSVHFVDERYGWAAGNGGAIFATVDGGRIWERQHTPTAADLYDIRFRDRGLGFAVGENGVILRTVDAGRTWVQVKTGLKHRLERLAFSGERAFVVGFGGAFLTAVLAEERSALPAVMKR